MRWREIERTKYGTYHESRYQYVYRNGYLVRQRRKLGPNGHRGVAYYDRERMKKPLEPIIHPGDVPRHTYHSGGYYCPDKDFEPRKYQAPPSWIMLPESWGAWEPVRSNYFQGEPNDGCETDGVATADTADYVLDDSGTDDTPIRLRFSDGATFLFASRALAEAALAELLKIRKAKHPSSRFSGRSTNTVFFTHARLRQLSQQPHRRADQDY